MNEVTTNAAMWSLIVGFFSPLVLSVIQQPKWSQSLRAVVGFVFAAVVGTGTAYFTNAFEGKSIVTSILLVFVVAITTYRNFWKPSGVAPSIETATSPKNDI